MNLWFDDKEEHEVSLSHTRVTLPHNKKDYELVFVYGLDEEHPMILLTNRSIHSKEDVIKVVRLYFYRWRIEEYFRSKKQEYDFENLRVRTLKSMNNLNLLLTFYLGFIGKQIEEMNKKLLSIKIIERSKSLRKKVVVWISQFARGIGEILSFAHNGIKEYKKIEQDLEDNKSLIDDPELGEMVKEEIPKLEEALENKKVKTIIIADKPSVENVIEEVISYMQ